MAPTLLVRASDEQAALDLSILSILAGEARKDAWVLADSPVRVVSLLQPLERAEGLVR